MARGESCPQCGRELVEITVHRGEKVFTLRSCSSCDRREWRLDGHRLPLRGVLEGLSEFEAANR